MKVPQLTMHEPGICVYQSSIRKSSQSSVLNNRRAALIAEHNGLHIPMPGS